jgi:site-specific DNA-methyltransferase (adenine-specific)
MKPYYEDEAVTIYHGDCREVLPGLEPVAHVITDPPYEAEAHTQQRRVKRGGGVMECEPLSFAPMWGAMRDFTGAQVRRLVKRWILTFCQIEAAPLWRKVYEDQGLVHRRTCIWVKPDGMPQYSGDRPGMGYETLLAMHTAGACRWNGGGRHGVFIVNKSDGAGASPHPTQKPLPLMTMLVSLFTDEGEIILDPFMGSGTTLRAAKDLGRKAIGIEIEERYCEIAAKRMSQSVFDFRSSSVLGE